MQLDGSSEVGGNAVVRFIASYNVKRIATIVFALAFGTLRVLFAWGVRRGAATFCRSTTQGMDFFSKTFSLFEVYPIYVKNKKQKKPRVQCDVR